MEFGHDNVRPVVEDRLSSLPDELIHQILSRFDMKFAVQTCLLSSRWELLWTSMPCLNFSHSEFCGDFCKFAKFVTHVLSHRNHQIHLSSVKLHFRRAGNADFVRKIANYAFSHNVQELVFSNWPAGHFAYPPCLFSSQSLKHFTFTNFGIWPTFCIPTTPWDFPALATLHIRGIGLCTELFSKCVNLKNLTLTSFCVDDHVEVFDIITPRLSNLMLIRGTCSTLINAVAPQLEILIIDYCSIKYLNVPPGLPYMCYTGNRHPPLSKHGFYSINKVTIRLSINYSNMLHKEEYAHNTINMLLHLRSARYLTLNADIVECISSFPDLLSHHLSPFSNLICLTIDSNARKDVYKVTMSTEAEIFLLGNSPNATLIMDDIFL